MYTDILHPTDGSDGSTAALDHVRDMAEAHDATVHVLHVVEKSQALGLGGDPKQENTPGLVGDPKGEGGGMVGEREYSKSIDPEHKEEAMKFLGSIEGDLAGIKTQTVLKSGSPHQVIIDYADENNIDLIVMGTHGQTGLDRHLIGSVTEKVVRMSDKPVVTVREPEL